MPDDWEPLGENVAGHTIMQMYLHRDGRSCVFHSRLASWAFGAWPDIDKRCLREHREEGRA